MILTIERGCPVGNKKTKKKAKAKRPERKDARPCVEKTECTHPLLDIPDNLALGQTLTVSDIHREYTVPEMRAKDRRGSTVRGISREVSRWNAWWRTVTSEPLPVAKIRRKHLELFRTWLAENGASIPKQNGAVRAVSQVLRTAVRHEILTHAVSLEALHHRGVSPKVYPSNEELDRVWRACDKMRWPRRDSKLRPLPYSPATAWRAALIIYRTYGLRTQELVQLEADFRSLTWANIHAPGLTPNPEGRMECDRGWLKYTPQKQERVKPEPLVLPLTRHVAAALRLVRNETAKPTAAVLDWSLSSESFYGSWHRLFEIAEVKPREISGVDRYLIKHLRKAATTEINKHRPGMGEHIVGHSSDRSADAKVSGISSKHYDNAEEAICECLATLPMPQSFDEILEGVRNAA